MRILFIHHVGGYSGAAKSLIERLLALPPGAVESTAIVPAGAASLRRLDPVGAAVCSIMLRTLHDIVRPRRTQHRAPALQVPPSNAAA